LSGQAAEDTVADDRHTQYGNRSVSMKPTADRLRCGEGRIVLAVLTDRRFVPLMTALDRPIARPGEHNDGVLAALGCDTAAIAALRDAQVT
jgi:crotonobetainyl-CoA:carnitine CoA-transferase CaiB-like acyl-CoA transferase